MSQKEEDSKKATKAVTANRAAAATQPTPASHNAENTSDNDTKIVVVADCKIPYLEALQEHPRIILKKVKADLIDAQTVKDADALLVRTRTRCDKELLEGSNVRFVGTATIGTDHIDKEYCKSSGITVVNAPGCNAPAVAQYVISSLMRVVNRPLEQHKIGIVGVGHVGKIVERWATDLGMDVLKCDPPRQRQEPDETFVSLERIAREADIITLHTPLTFEGQDPTYHLINSEVISQFKRAPILVNAARGPVMDTKAVVEGFDRGKISKCIIDCWEGEPKTADPELLECTAIATPHIAGYSVEGKQRATAMTVEALMDFFDLTPVKPTLNPPVPEHTPSAVRIMDSFDPTETDYALRNKPTELDRIRDTYILRNEPC